MGRPKLMLLYESKVNVYIPTSAEDLLPEPEIFHLKYTERVNETLTNW